MKRLTLLQILRVKLIIYLALISMLATGNTIDVYNCKAIYNPTDVTNGLQKAFDSDAKKIVIPFMGDGTKWITGPLLIRKGNKEIVLEPGVILESIPGNAYKSQTASLITLNQVSNVSISGNGATLRMLKEEYIDGEWRMGISIRGSANITITDLEINKSGGDGIYIGVGNKNPCTNIIIDNVKLNDNSRNGISVISCKDCLIKNCKIKNTGASNNKGLAAKGPYAGIDIEPNSSSEMVENVHIEDCEISNNKKYGILIYCTTFDTSSSKSIFINKNYLSENAYGIYIGQLEKSSIGKISITNNTITGAGTYGLYIKNWKQTKLDLSINDCLIDSKSIRNPLTIEANDTIKFDSKAKLLKKINIRNSKKNTIINTN